MPAWIDSVVVRPMAWAGRSNSTRASREGAGEQRLRGDAHARRDRAAQVVAVGVDRVEHGGGAEVDDDQRGRPVPLARRDRVHDAVRAHLVRVLVADAHAGADRAAHDDRLDAEEAAADRLEDGQQDGHDAGDRRPRPPSPGRHPSIAAARTAGCRTRPTAGRGPSPGARRDPAHRRSKIPAWIVVLPMSTGQQRHEGAPSSAPRAAPGRAARRLQRGPARRVHAHRAAHVGRSVRPRAIARPRETPVIVGSIGDGLSPARGRT